jgi:hypothetical protein
MSSFFLRVPLPLGLLLHLRLLIPLPPARSSYYHLMRVWDKKDERHKEGWSLRRIQLRFRLFLQLGLQFPGTFVPQPIGEPFHNQEKD